MEILLVNEVIDDGAQNAIQIENTGWGGPAPDANACLDRVKGLTYNLYVENTYKYAPRIKKINRK